MLSIKDVSERLNISERTVRNLLNSGELYGYKIGGIYRVNEEDLNNYLKKSKVEKETKNNEQWNYECKWCSKNRPCRTA